MKALILAAGAGTRLRPLTNTRAKPLLPVANKPALFYVIERVAEVGIREVGIIISPQTGELIREKVGDGSRWDISITYIFQSEPRGLAHAVTAGQEFLGDSDFVLFLGDILLQKSLQPLVTRFEDTKPDALVLLAEVSDPRSYGVVELNGEGRAIGLEEKPKEPRSNLAIVGVYVFSPEIHKAISRIHPSQRGELEITDAIQELVNKGRLVAGHTLDGWWPDTGNKENLLLMNRLALEEFLNFSIQGRVDSKSQIEGKVWIGEDTVVEDSQIQGPASIAPHCHIRNSSIGPYTSIGKGTTIERCLVENSIILEDCFISGVSSFRDSLVGEGTKISGTKDSIAIDLMVGDKAVVEL